MMSLFSCIDCGVNTRRLREYYMLRDEVWLQTGLGFDDGKLCIGCVEKRIGRRLKPSDFIDCPINQENYRHSKRLRERLSFEVADGAAESRVTDGACTDLAP
jgi:hypothetical protein